MTEEYKIDTVAIILAEMLKESRKDEITKGEFYKLPQKYAERLVKLFAIPDVSKQSEMLCGFFEPVNDRSSATICKHCGREKWMHPKAT